MLRIFYFTEQYVVLNCDVTKTILATDVNYCTFQAIHCRAGHATIFTVATSTTRQCKRTSVTYDEKRKFISPWCKTGVATTYLATRQHTLYNMVKLSRQFSTPYIIWSNCRDSCPMSTPYIIWSNCRDSCPMSTPYITWSNCRDSSPHLI